MIPTASTDYHRTYITDCSLIVIYSSFKFRQLDRKNFPFDRIDSLSSHIDLSFSAESLKFCSVFSLLEAEHPLAPDRESLVLLWRQQAICDVFLKIYKYYIKLEYFQLELFIQCQL